MKRATTPSREPAGSYQLISLDHEHYPPLLREIPGPPEQLYVRGDINVLHKPQLAIVGSRKASPAALRVTQLLAGQLCEAGFSICSGLALGVDGAAHRGALASGGNSVAVMATGIDRLYPRRHVDLASELVGSGVLVTEFPPGTAPRRENFPQRNRIISGLSLGVLVIEAAQRSGSLITARMALEQGREVFALPWSMLHEGGRGCLALLRDGAKMVQSVEDILEELGPLWHALPEKPPGAPHEQAKTTEPAKSAGLVEDSAVVLSELTGPAAVLLPLVGFEASSLDDLVASSGLPVAQVLQAMSTLELAGKVCQTAGGYIRQ